MRKEQKVGEEKGWVFDTYKSIMAPQPHFVSAQTTESDRIMEWGNSYPDAVVIQSHWTMANILKEAGWFPSVSEAKKNGKWNEEPIPDGASCWINKSRDRCLWILNIKEQEHESVQND